MAIKNTALIVLGMHRSGTSAVTRVFNLLGAQLGTKLMPSAANNNETGFWERKEVRELHDRLLASFGSHWDDFRPMPEGWCVTSMGMAIRDEMAELLRHEFGTAPLWIVKDPRACRLVPFWLSVTGKLQVEPIFLVVFRNPLAVAASLEKRDGFPSCKSVLLWLRHVFDAEHESRGFRRAFINYDDLLQDWRLCVADVSSQLGMDLTREISTQGAEIDAFVSHDRRHQSFSDAALQTNPVVAGWASETFAALKTMKGAASRQSRDELDRLATILRDATHIFVPWLELYQGVVTARGQQIEGLEVELNVARAATAAQRQHLDELTAETDTARSERVKREVQLRSLTADLQKRSAELTELQSAAESQVKRMEEEAGRLNCVSRELEDSQQKLVKLHAANTALDARSRQLSTGLAEAQAANTALDARSRQLSAELAEAQTANTALDARSRQLSAELAEAKASITGQKSQIAVLTVEVNAMRSSLSWRLTRPLRILRQWLRRLTGKQH